MCCNRPRKLQVTGIGRNILYHHACFFVTPSSALQTPSNSELELSNELNFYILLTLLVHMSTNKHAFHKVPTPEIKFFRQDSNLT
jgi:hypothetical protein